MSLPAQRIPRWVTRLHAVLVLCSILLLPSLGFAAGGTAVAARPAVAASGAGSLQARVDEARVKVNALLKDARRTDSATWQAR